MATLQEKTMPLSSNFRSLQSALMLMMHYVSLAGAAVVAMAVALMCSGSELATILMAASVFLLGLVLGKVWIAAGRNVKVIPTKSACKHEPNAPNLAHPAVNRRATGSQSPSPPPTPPRESAMFSASTLVSSVASADGAGQGRIFQPADVQAPMDMESCNWHKSKACNSSSGSCSENVSIFSRAPSIAAADDVPCTPPHYHVSISATSSRSSQQHSFVSLTAQDKVPMTILSFLYPHRLTLFSASEYAGTLPILKTHQRSSLQLVSVKLHDSSVECKLSQLSDKTLHCYYWTVSGPDVATCTPQAALEELGCFGALSTRKAMLQLHLLHIPACTFSAPRSCTRGVEVTGSSKRLAVFDLSPDRFTLLKAEGNEGCGFICSTLLSSLFGNTAEAQRLLVVQIHAVVPGQGIFTGKLVRAPIPPGDTPIQLTPSMQKVVPSAARPRVTRNSEKRACLLVNRMLPLSQHVMVGRAVNPKRNGPPPKSSKPCPLLNPGQTAKQGTITRLWCALGVKAELCESYTAEAAKSWKHLAHSWVVGVSDPTHEIPFDSVFVTGCHDGDGKCASSHFFTTPSPCIQRSSSKILKQLVAKPPAMSEEHWEFLITLPFGAIIFPDAAEGKQPIPAAVPRGDDAAWYFVCWDAKVIAGLVDTRLNSIHSMCINARIAARSVESGMGGDGGKSKWWLEDCQDIMSDGQSISDHQMLAEILYKLAEKAAELCEDECVSDGDPAAFADAYEQSLTYLKHGGPVQLPRHLHCEIPRRLQKYLCE